MKPTTGLAFALLMVLFIAVAPKADPAKEKLQVIENTYLKIRLSVPASVEIEQHKSSTTLVGNGGGRAWFTAKIIKDPPLGGPASIEIFRKSMLPSHLSDYPDSRVLAAAKKSAMGCASDGVDGGTRCDIKDIKTLEGEFAVPAYEFTLELISQYSGRPITREQFKHYALDVSKSGEGRFLIFSGGSENPLSMELMIGVMGSLELLAD